MAGGPASLAALNEALPGGVVDAHHHLWDLSAGRYPWLQDEYDGAKFFLGPYAAICRDYGVAELRRDQAPLRLAASVHIEAERDRSDQLGETRWLEHVNRAAGLPSAIVAHIDFRQPDRDQVLQAHLRCPLVRGIRSKPVTSARPGESVRGQPGTLDDPMLLEGLAAFQTAGLSWDLRVPFWHLREAAGAISAFPALTVIVNHCGLPLDRSEDGLAAWRGGLEALAGHPGTFLKLSEFGLAGGGFDPAGTARVVREAVAVFGPSRVMYGSNLPVSSLGAPMPAVVAAMLGGLGDAQPELLRQVFAETACRAYRVEIEAS